MNSKSHLQEENITSQLIIKIYLELPQEMKEDIKEKEFLLYFVSFFFNWLDLVKLNANS